mgnify:CR=1 FL=1
MCIGIPMQVMEAEGTGGAWCVGRDGRQQALDVYAIPSERVGPVFGHGNDRLCFLCEHGSPQCNSFGPYV